MYFLHEVSEIGQTLEVRSKEIVRLLTDAIPPLRTSVKLPAASNIFSLESSQGKLFVLKEGALSYSFDGRVLFFFDSGDLVGFEHALLKPTAKILSDFAVVVDEYSIDSFLAAFQRDPNLLKLWSEFLAVQFSAMTSLCAAFVKVEPDVPPDIKAFRPGEVIIEQGTKANEVFTLVEGEAEAIVSDVVVGNIQTGEIFGVIAALTGIPRTATVRASTPCTILSLPRENFVQLIENRPSTFLKVVEDMARTMVSLNDQVVSLTLSKF